MIYYCVLYMYQVVRAIRYALLYSLFGSVSHCKHSPTCGTVFMKTVKEKKYKQLPAVLAKVLRCW